MTEEKLKPKELTMTEEKLKEEAKRFSREAGIRYEAAENIIRSAIKNKWKSL